MKHWSTILIVAAMAGCSAPHADHDATVPDEQTLTTPALDQPALHLRSYQEINRVVRQRIFRDPDAEFELAYYFNPDAESPYAKIAPGLEALLGAHTGNGLDSDYRNGKPNSLNMLLWYVVFHGLGTDFGRQCSDPNVLVLPPAVEQTILNLCQWQRHGSESRAISLQVFWDTFVGRDSSPAEEQAWTQFAYSLGEETAPADRLRELTVAAFYNPQFLISN